MHIINLCESSLPPKYENVINFCTHCPCDCGVRVCVSSLGHNGMHCLVICHTTRTTVAKRPKRYDCAPHWCESKSDSFAKLLNTSYHNITSDENSGGGERRPRVGSVLPACLRERVLVLE